MPIAFDQIPSDIRVPLWWAELRGAQTPLNNSLRQLIIGARNTSVGAPAAIVNHLYPLSDDEVRRLFGPGSMVERSYLFARRNAPFLEIWGIAAAPPIGGVVATGRVQVSAAPSVILSGPLRFFIAGQPVLVAALRTDTAAGLATKIAATINKQRSLPVTAAVDGSDATVVNLTMKWPGVSGNSILLEKNIWGMDNRLAGGLLTLTQMANGAGDHFVGDALATIGDHEFDVVTIANQASTGKLDDIDDFYNPQDGQWSPFKQKYGHSIIGSVGDFAGLITFGDGRNGPHVSVLGAPKFPSPIWEITGAVGAQMGLHWAAPPELSRPLHTLELLGIIPPRDPSDWFDITERQALLGSGISTFKIDSDRKVRIEKIVTTYKTNVWGDPDESWKNAKTLFQGMYFVRYMRAAITGEFGRAALSDVDTGIEGFASPSQVGDAFIQAYIELVGTGLVENADAFAEGLIVERNALNPDRVDAFMRPDVVNDLGVVAVLVETVLQGAAA